MTPPGALEGVRVIELGDGIASAYASRLLGDHGADVLTAVGSPGNHVAELGSSAVTPGSPLFEYLHWNKRAVAAGSDHDLDELIAGVDIVIAGGLHDPGRLRAANSRAVITMVSNFGQTGPDRDLVATDLVLQAMSGIMAISGSYGREPLRHGLRTSYYLAGLNAAYASIAGLFAVHRTGDGVTIDLAIRDCLSSELVMNHALHVFTGIVQTRSAAVGDPFDGHPIATADGFVALQTSARQSAADIARLLDTSALADHRFASAEARATSGHELRAILGERLGAERALEVFLRASEQGLLSGAVQNAKELLACAQLEHRGVFEQLGDEGNDLRLPAVLATLSVTPTSVRHRAPRRLIDPATLPNDAHADRSPDAAPADQVDKPLAGLRVLDLSVIFAVPYMAALLADLGAEVIKIEAPARIDQTRTDWGGYHDNTPGEEPWNRSGTFQVVNRGKRSFAVDLTTSSGQDLFRQLVGRSDVVLENLSRSVPAKLGVTYEELREANPELVMLSNTGYGATGPWSQFKAQGTTLEATMGLMALTGYEDGPPARAGQSVPDFIACWAGLVALLAALWHHERTGEGQWIDLGMYQLGPAMIPEALIAHQTGTPLPRRGPAGDLDATDSWLLPARDDWLAIAVQDQARLNALRARLDGRELADWVAERDAWPAARELQRDGIAAGPVLDAESLLRDPQLTSRGFFEDVHIPALKQTRSLIGRPFRWTATSTSVGIATCAPAFGADNDYVLRELLGLDDRQIRRLRANRIVADRPVNPPPAAPIRTGRRPAQGPRDAELEPV